MFFSLMFTEALGVGFHTKQGRLVLFHHLSVGSCCPLGQDVDHHNQKVNNQKPSLTFSFVLTVSLL